MPRLLVVFIALSLVGCAGTHVSLPGATPLGGMATSASYEVIGDATGTAEGTVVLGLFTFGDADRRGSIGLGGLMVLPDPIEAAATYDAIASVPGADAIIAPRVTNESTNYIVWREQRSTVRGKAIRIVP